MKSFAVFTEFLCLFCPRDSIIDLIENNRISVIKGATGSGKTTRIPQMILDKYIELNRGTDCNILVTQPRRISATSLAVRIASERNENVRFLLVFYRVEQDPSKKDSN